MQEHVDKVLLGNYYMDHGTIVDLLWELNQEEYDWIYTNRKRYPKQIQEILEPEDFRVSKHPSIKLKLREILDKEFYSLEAKEEKLQAERDELEWQRYILDHNLDRPLGPHDTESDNLFQQIQYAEAKLDLYMKNRKVKYVPPSMRGSIKDPKQTELENGIQELVDALSKNEEVIKQEDERWLTEQKLLWIKNGKML